MKNFSLSQIGILEEGDYERREEKEREEGGGEIFGDWYNIAVASYLVIGTFFRSSEYKLGLYFQSKQVRLITAVIKPACNHTCM